MGPSTDHRGTPEEQYTVDDVEFPRRALCDRPIIYKERHSKTVRAEWPESIEV
jgi:hypothetical protein